MRLERSTWRVHLGSSPPPAEQADQAQQSEKAPEPPSTPAGIAGAVGGIAITAGRVPFRRRSLRGTASAWIVGVRPIFWVGAARGRGF